MRCQAVTIRHICLSHPFTSRLMSRLDSCSRPVTLRFMLGLADVRKFSLPIWHLFPRPPPPCGVARCRDAPPPPVSCCTSRRPFYACNQHRYSPELHGGHQPLDMEQLLNKNLNRGYFCDACGVMHQNQKKVRAR